MGYLIAKEAYKKDPSQLNETEKQTVAALSTLASGLAGALAGNSTEAVATAAKAGQTTVENNFLGESSRKRKDELVQKGLTEGLTLDEEKELVSLDTNNQLSDEYLDKYRHDPGSLTPDERDILNLALTAFYNENLKYYDTDTVNKMVGSLFAEGATFRDYSFPYAASSELKNKITDINKAGLGFWDALTYTRDISPQERLYKDAISDLGVVNEHAYWARVGEPVLNFLPGAPGLLVNVKDAITGGSQMGQATASFLNDGPNADSAGRFLEGFLNAAGAVAGTHWGYKDGVTPSGSYSPPWQNSTIVPEKEMATVSASAIGLKWGEGNMKQGMPWEDYVGTTPAHNAASYAGLNMDLKTTEAANEVVESLRNTGQLPQYYLDKTQAMTNGWKPLNNTNPGGQIGGDIFQNSTNILPSSAGRVWREADIGINNTMSRSNQPGTRLLYSNDGLLYITTDHYETATSIGRWK